MSAAVDVESRCDVVPAHRAEEVLGTGQILSDIEPTVGAAGLGGVDRAVGVDQAGALLVDAVEQVVAVHRHARRSDQLALELIGRQGRIRLDHQGGDARDHRRGLGGAGHLVIDAAYALARVENVSQAMIRQDAIGVTARGDQLGLEKALDRRTGGGVGRQPVVGTVAGGEVVGHAADGDAVGKVAGHADGHRVRTGIAR